MDPPLRPRTGQFGDRRKRARVDNTSAEEGATGEPQKPAARRIPAGIADAAFASLATFGAGLSAVTLFNDVDRGVYALFFTAFQLGVVLPWNLILIPAEVNAVSYPVVDRMRRAPDTLKLGLRMSIIGSLAILVAAFLAMDLTSTDTLIALTVTAMITTVLSPLQDHMRRLLHISDRSWRAATMSMVQFGVVAVSLTILWLVEAPVALMPFGSLVLANAISLTTGVVVADVIHKERLPERLRFWDLAREGKWLLAQAIIPSGAHFAVAAIVAAIAGAEVLGYAEAARVVAQPVLVFATGLTAVLAPRAMRAAMDVDIDAAQAARRLFLGLVGLAGLAYLAVASTDWVLNPMAYIVPAAYTVSWLVAAMIVANMSTAALYLDTNELLGARKAKDLSVVSIVLSPILIAVAFTASQIGAFAIPVGGLLRNGCQITWYQAMLRRHYPHSRYLRGSSPD